mmetsp:Transcript_70482/g.190589  ORF Transcript_70482/g.190589 Transcript_70482/m.190589 type:complete len:200 (-) Transcript_70482:736-1335(-)
MEEASSTATSWPFHCSRTLSPSLKPEVSDTSRVTGRPNSCFSGRRMSFTTDVYVVSSMKPLRGLNAPFSRQNTSQACLSFSSMAAVHSATSALALAASFTIRSTSAPPWGEPAVVVRVWMPHSVFACRTKRPARSLSCGSTGTVVWMSPKDLNTYVMGAGGSPLISLSEHRQNGLPNGTFSHGRSGKCRFVASIGAWAR